MSTYSGFPKETSRLVANQHREEYRRNHGRNPPPIKETIDTAKALMDNLTPKDIAALGVRLAESDVQHFQMFCRTGLELMEAENRLIRAQQKYREVPGKETPIPKSLREKVCEVLDSDKTKTWLVRDIATLVGHPANHVGVVVGFLRKDKNKKWNVK